MAREEVISSAVSVVILPELTKALTLLEFRCHVRSLTWLSNWPFTIRRHLDNTNNFAVLQDSSVSSAPLEKRIAFLQSKNLTQEEIDMAISRASEEGSTVSPVTNPARGYGLQQQFYQGPPPPGYSSPQYGQWPPPPE